MRISVIVPAYNAEGSIGRLFDALDRQTRKDFELIVVDDASTDHTPDIAAARGALVFKMPKNGGPAACRNKGAANASGEFLVFTDSDCEPAPDWIDRIERRAARTPTDALMGRVVIPRSTFLGNAISALGFPAGGSAGFERIWPVDPAGRTISLSTCNCAVPRDLFYRVSGFDESFPYAGGEDSLLARRLLEAGACIRFCPDMLVTHDARSDLAGFLRWQYKRGKSSFLFSRKVARRSKFVGMRLWSTKNVLADNAASPRFGLVFLLLALGYTAQIFGFLAARFDGALHERSDRQPPVAR